MSLPLTPVRDIIDLTKKPILQSIISESAAMYGVTVDDVKAPNGDKKTRAAKRMAAYLCRKHTDKSSPVIARAMGRKDHTTILHHANGMPAKIAKSWHLAGQIATIEKKLGL